MKHILTSLTLSLLACTLGYAQSQPASKATAKVGNVAILDSTGMGWTTILSNTLKTSNQKDLFVNVSLEAGLYTQTQIKSKAGTSDTSYANAGIKVRVLVDGVEALPGEVIFARRSQTLTAKLGGILLSLKDVNGDGVITLDEMELADEEIDLVLNTMNANAFSFIFENVASGVHTIQVQAKVQTDTTVQTGTAGAKASIGKGTVTVEEVRMIKNAEITF